jgi:hypothetical protein
MKKIYLPGLILLQLSIVIGCAKPDRVAVFKSPDPELFYTVETYNGQGAVVSDFTRVYAHLERDGKTDIRSLTAKQPGAPAFERF